MIFPSNLNAYCLVNFLNNSVNTYYNLIFMFHQLFFSHISYQKNGTVNNANNNNKVSSNPNMPLCHETILKSFGSYHVGLYLRVQTCLCQSQHSKLVYVDSSVKVNINLWKFGLVSSCKFWPKDMFDEWI